MQSQIQPLPTTNTTDSTDPPSRQMKTISTRRRSINNNRRFLYILVAFLILVICISVGVFVGTNNNSNKMESSSNHKTEWPELTGTNGTDAKQIIEDAQDPNDPYRITQVYIVPQDAMVTMDYVTSRVRIFVDDNGTVVGVPKIG